MFLDVAMFSSGGDKAEGDKAEGDKAEGDKTEGDKAEDAALGDGNRISTAA